MPQICYKYLPRYLPIAPCSVNTTMAPNKLFHRLKRTIAASSATRKCPACIRTFRSKGGLTKHLRSTHPGIDNSHSALGQHSPDAHSQVSLKSPSPSSESQVAPSPEAIHIDSPSPLLSPSSTHNPPSLPTIHEPLEDAHTEDPWHMDVDQNPDLEESIRSSSPAFSVRSRAPADHPDIVGHAPEQHYTRVYHSKLNGVYHPSTRAKRYAKSIYR